MPKTANDSIQSVPKGSQEAQNRQRSGSARTRWGSLQRSPRPPSWMGGAGAPPKPTPPNRYAWPPPSSNPGYATEPDEPRVGLMVDSTRLTAIL